MSVNDRHHGTGHAVKEDGGTFHHFDLNSTGFELFAHVANKVRPVLSTRNNATQVTHHLATVTDTQSERITTFKELGEHFHHHGVAQNGRSPTAAGTQDVTVGEATASGQTNEVLQVRATGQQVRHVNVNGFEAGTRKGSGHFRLTVNTLLSQDGHARTNTRCDEGSSHVKFGIKRRLNE